MADITTPATVRFCNEQGRVLADTLRSAFETARMVQEYYYAHPEIGAELTANMGGLVIDGSETDGRGRITGNDVLGLITRASELTADYGANNSAKLNVVLKVAVNGGPKVSG